MITLKATKREGGKASSVRAKGLLPAVVYGRKEASTAISIPVADFEKALEEAGESTIISLEGLGESKDVLIHDVSRDVVTGALLHADLYAIEKGQTVTVEVPLEFEGVSPAVKDLGGILVKVMHEIEVEAQPRDLPHEIKVNISALIELDSQIHVKDLAIPAGVTVNAEPEDVVAMVSVAQEEKEAAPIDLSAIETSVERGKKEEETEGEAA